MPESRWRILFAAVVLLSVSLAPAMAASNDTLIKLLKQKGLISEEEASGLLEEAENYEKVEKEEERVFREEMMKEQEALKEDIKKEMDNPAGFVEMFKSGKLMQLGGRIQFQGTLADNERSGNSRPVDFDRRFRDRDGFFFRRVYLEFRGEPLDDWSYKVQADIADSGDTNLGVLRDVYIDYKPAQYAKVRMGQFYAPFSFEELTSDTEVQTIERSLVVDSLTPGRELGVQVSGDVFGKKVEYYAGIFNGAGMNQRGNDGDEFMYVARLVYIPVKDVELMGKKTKLQLAVNGLISSDREVELYADYDNLFGEFRGNRDMWGADMHLQWGPVGLKAEYIDATLDRSNRFERTLYDDIEPDGFYVQGSYDFKLLKRSFQLVAKYEEFDAGVPSPGFPFAIFGDEVEEDRWTLGLTYFVKKDDLKFMLNWVDIDRENDFRGDVDRQLLQGRVQVMF